MASENKVWTSNGADGSKGCVGFQNRDTKSKGISEFSVCLPGSILRTKGAFHNASRRGEATPVWLSKFIRWWLLMHAGRVDSLYWILEREICIIRTYKLYRHKLDLAAYKGSAVHLLTSPRTVLKREIVTLAIAGCA